MAVTITPGSSTGDLNGATDVTVVAAPAANTTRTVLSFSVYNADSAVVTISLQKDISGTERVEHKITGLAVEATWNPITKNNPLILSATTHSLEAFMGGAAAGTNPTYEATWIDRLTS